MKKPPKANGLNNFKFKPSKIFKRNIAMTNENKETTTDFVFQMGGQEYRVSIESITPETAELITNILTDACNTVEVHSKIDLFQRIALLADHGLMERTTATEFFNIVEEIRADLKIQDYKQVEGQSVFAEKLKETAKEMSAKADTQEDNTMPWPDGITEAGKKMALGLIALHRFMGHKGSMPQMM